MRGGVWDWEPLGLECERADKGSGYCESAETVWARRLRERAGEANMPRWEEDVRQGNETGHVVGDLEAREKSETAVGEEIEVGCVKKTKKPEN